MDDWISRVGDVAAAEGATIATAHQFNSCEYSCCKTTHTCLPASESKPTDYSFATRFFLPRLRVHLCSVPQVYGSRRTRQGVSVPVVHHTQAHGQRYQVDKSNKQHLERLLTEGKRKVSAVLESLARHSRREGGLTSYVSVALCLLVSLHSHFFSNRTQIISYMKDRNIDEKAIAGVSSDRFTGFPFQKF